MAPSFRELHRIPLGAAIPADQVCPALHAEGVATLCRWTASGDAVVLNAEGVPLDLSSLAAARPGDLDGAVLVIYSRVLAAAFMHVPSHRHHHPEP